MHNFYECFFPKSIKFSYKQDLIEFCISKCNNKKVALDIGADLCEGLTKTLIDCGWSEKIYAFDLWTMREPDQIDNVEYIKGDILDTLQPTLKKIHGYIDILEIDLRNIHIDNDPQDNDPSSDPFRLNDNTSWVFDILNLIRNRLSENTIILINDFHGYDGQNFLHKDAHSLSKWLISEKFYDCIGHSEHSSAWILNGPYSNEDFSNFIKIYK